VVFHGPDLELLLGVGPSLRRFAREIVPTNVGIADGAPSSPQAGKKPAGRILVVDDERLIRWCLRGGLRGDGWDVDEAEDGETALHLLATDSDRFAGVIMDYDHRFCDPLDLSLLRQIRRVAPRVPVLLLTACAEPAMRAEAIACGAIGVIDKPFDVSAVIARIRAAIDHSG
jgi:DNA-binding response OmpR family regulator